MRSLHLTYGQGAGRQHVRDDTSNHSLDEYARRTTCWIRGLSYAFTPLSLEPKINKTTPARRGYHSGMRRRVFGNYSPGDPVSHPERPTEWRLVVDNTKNTRCSLRPTRDGLYLYLCRVVLNVAKVLAQSLEPWLRYWHKVWNRG
jgi:hypothetical protein